MVFWRPRGCVLWFDFAELKGDKVYDLSGNGNHGTIYGAKWKRGPLIGSLYFDGEDDYVETKPLSIPPCTIEMLIAVHRIPYGDYQELFSQENLGASIPPNSRAYHCADYQGHYIRCYNVFTSVNTFYHIVTVIDVSPGETLTADKIRVYVNGERWTNYSVSEGTWNTTTPTKFRLAYRYDNQFPANITYALFRVYSRVLSEREIDEHYFYLMRNFSKTMRAKLT